MLREINLDQELQINSAVRRAMLDRQILKRFLKNSKCPFLMLTANARYCLGVRNRKDGVVEVLKRTR